MPRYSPRLGTRIVVFAAVWCLMSAAAWACNVPVFRYALERWPSDPYHLAVFHGEDEQESVQSILASLEGRPINVEVELLDVAQIEEDDWRIQGVELDHDQLPWAVLRYPPLPGPPPPIAWSGELDAEVLEGLAHSNARQEVIRRLLTGESAVWVLIESGDAEKDQAARERLESHLEEAERELQIPGLEELDYAPEDEMGPGPELLGPHDVHDEFIPLKVGFSIISLARDNLAEARFIDLLLGTEPDLHEYADQPMVFPVFGQGRALWALVGEGINSRNIIESCVFLTGPCSCQIKHLNPGTDLMMEFDWYGALEGRVPPPPEVSVEMLTSVMPVLDEDQEESLAASGEAGQSGEEALETEDAEQTAADGAVARAAPVTAADRPVESAGGGTSLLLITGVMLGGLLLLVGGTTLVLLGKKKE